MKSAIHSFGKWILGAAVLALILSGAGVDTLQAQPYLQGGINFMTGFPQDEFKDNVDKTGFGIGLEGAFIIPQSPLRVGLSFGYLVYGSENREEPFSLTIPDVTVDVHTENSIVQGHLFLRVQPPEGPVRPYLDGLIGFNYLFTQTRIKDQGNSDEEIASSTNFDDFAFSYGAGGGIMFRVYKSNDLRPEGSFGLSNVNIDLRVRYLFGGEAEYLKEGSITRTNGRVTYDVSHSKTNLVMGQLGVIVEF